MQTEIQLQKIEIEKALQKHSFNALEGILEPDDKLILGVMLKANAALSETAIRGAVIEHIARRRKKEILSKYGIASDDLEWNAAREGLRSAITKTMQKPSNVGEEFRFRVSDTFTEDMLVLKYGRNVVPMTEKINIWIRALQGIEKIPRRQDIKKNLVALTYFNLIGARDLHVSKKQRGKTKVLYYVLPEIYDLWKKS